MSREKFDHRYSNAKPQYIYGCIHCTRILYNTILYSLRSVPRKSSLILFIQFWLLRKKKFQFSVNSKLEFASSVVIVKVEFHLSIIIVNGADKNRIMDKDIEYLKGELFAFLLPFTHPQKHYGYLYGAGLGIHFFNCLALLFYLIILSFLKMLENLFEIQNLQFYIPNIFADSSLTAGRLQIMKRMPELTFRSIFYNENIYDCLKIKMYHSQIEAKRLIEF